MGIIMAGSPSIKLKKMSQDKPPPKRTSEYKIPSL